MRKVCAKMVSKNLAFEQKESRQSRRFWPSMESLCWIIHFIHWTLPRVTFPRYLFLLQDIFLFPKIKSALKGTRFETVEAVKDKAAQTMNMLSENDFQHCFDQWKIRMVENSCKDHGGKYIEGYNVQKCKKKLLRFLQH